MNACANVRVPWPMMLESLHARLCDCCLIPCCSPWGYALMRTVRELRLLLAGPHAGLAMMRKQQRERDVHIRARLDKVCMWMCQKHEIDHVPNRTRVSKAIDSVRGVGAPDARGGSRATARGHGGERELKKSVSVRWVCQVMRGETNEQARAHRTLSHTHTHSLSLSLSHTHTHTHTHAHTHTHLGRGRQHLVNDRTAI
jgi:hypothetical protein